MIAAGQSIGNYRILNKIGTGGMGAVYLAEHPLIGKRVALKVIHRELAGNRDVVSRFFQEARAVNKIGNEHIVEIHDFGVTPEGDHFFIMEYLEGKTLASILSHGPPMEMMRTLHVGAQIAAALSAAHVAGIIHRDLKPDNIMLMPRLGDQDFVKVLDFGLAKVFSAATAVKTAAGVLLGTPQYMSPEACESRGDVDHRTDIYALGVLLFQMMTGVLPFDGESMGEVLVKQVTALPPAPRALNPAIPPSVEQILLRCLAKPVDARFATMMQLREALLDPEAYLRGSPPIAPARSVSRGGMGEAKTLMVTGVHAPYPAQGGPPQGYPTAAHPAQGGYPQGGYPAQGGYPGMPRHGAGLPLPAPPASMQGNAATMIGGYGDYAPGRRATSGMPALAPPQEPKMNTMRIATPIGYTSRPPRKVWPVVLALAVLLGVGGGVFSVVQFGHGDDAGAAGSAAPAAAPGSAAPAATGSAAPTATNGATASGSAAATNGAAANGSAAAMNGSAATNGAAATTNGSAATNGAAATNGSAATNGAAATNGSAATNGAAATNGSAGATTGSAATTGAAATTGSATTTGAAATAGSATANGAAAATAATNGTTAKPGAAPAATNGSAALVEKAPPAGTPAPPARPATAHLSIDSTPQGAAVTGPHGESLGRTPVELEWPVSAAPAAFELRLAGYRKKQKQLVIRGNTALRVDLERVQPAPRRAAEPPPPANGSGNGLMRPDE